MDRRTSLITAATVGGALLVGSGAIAANIGVLNSANDDSIGNLSSEAVLEVPPSTIEAQVIDIYVEDPPLPTTAAPTTAPTMAADTSDVVVQAFAVEEAGTVTVEQTPTGLFVSEVQANEGWAWTAELSTPNALDVVFVSGDTTYEFHAEVGLDGLVTARVDQPIINVVREPAPSNGANNSGGYQDDDGEHDDEHDDDEHDDDEHDDDEHDDDEHDDDEHEGGDDDD
jgi:hypothetical protein